MIRHLATVERQYDYFIFFSYRYYHAYYGIRAVPLKAMLVPTAERDPAIGVSLFQPIFRSVRAIMYNSHEEQAMIRAASGNAQVPGVVVGVGSEVPDRPQPERFRRKYDLRGHFAIYVGRIDENKGCKELFEFFQRYVALRTSELALVLIGASILPVPAHPRIRHLGFLPDEDKKPGIAARAVGAVMLRRAKSAAGFRGRSLWIRLESLTFLPASEMAGWKARSTQVAISRNPVAVPGP